MKLYIFPTVRLSIIRSYSLYTQQWYVIHVFEKLEKLVHLVGFITWKFVTMHGHMNVKKEHRLFIWRHNILSIDVNFTVRGGWWNRNVNNRNIINRNVNNRNVNNRNVNNRNVNNGNVNNGNVNNRNVNNGNVNNRNVNNRNVNNRNVNNTLPGVLWRDWLRLAQTV
jgi:hypothetical protein